MAAPSQRASSERDDVSRILKLCRIELQQLNLDRILRELEQKDILSKGIANVLKRKTSTEKSNVLVSVLQSRDPQDFKTFLQVVFDESDVKFIKSTEEFLTMVSIYPGYENYRCDFDNRMKEAAKGDGGPTHNFIQVGDDTVFTVRRDGKTYYDPVNGITVHIPKDSLPHETEQIEITVKVGYNDYDLSAANMIICSATVKLQSIPQVIFTKDVFLEIPHSASSAVMNDLCFVKFKDDVCETGYGEVYNGIFSIDHPYGVIMTKSFSSYVIVKGKRLFYPQLSVRKTCLPRHKRYFCKLQQSKHHGLTDRKDWIDQGNSNLFWFGIKKISTNNENNNNFSFMVAQYTPTGFHAMKEYSTKPGWEWWSSFTFAADQLTFHPQMAEDCGWRASIDGFYKINKKEAERMFDGCGALRIPMIQYSLVPTRHELEIPSIVISVSGANKKICYTLTTKLSHYQASTNKCEMLCNLAMHPVVEDEFLQQLAYQLPVWEPVAQMLGLTASDIEHIDYDVPPYQGEKAYKAFLQWMQKKGRHHATYDVLLQALCQATQVSDCKSITNAWWYAHHYLSNLAEQPCRANYIAL